MSKANIPLRTIATDPYKRLKENNTKYVSFGSPTLDDAFNGLESKTVMVVTGRPAEGKSTFVHNIILNAIDTRKKVLLIDGEHNQNDLYNNLFRKVIGNDKSLYDTVTCNRKHLREPKPQVLDMLTKWFGTNLMVAFKNEIDVDSFGDMFDLMEGYCKTSNIDLVVLDNLMSLVSSSQVEINAKQSDFMKHCTNLAKSANVAVILVAHPNQSAQKGKEIDYYQISGTSDIPNLMDNAIQIIKDPTSEDGAIECQGRAIVLKNRKYSEYPKVNFEFDSETMALCELRDGKRVVKKYDWRMEGTQKWIKNDMIPF